MKMKKEKNYRELKEDLYCGYFVCLIFLIGVILRIYIPWTWLRNLPVFGLVTTLLELIPLQYKYLKVKKSLSGKNEIE